MRGASTADRNSDDLFLTGTSGRPPVSLNDDGGLAAETTNAGLRAEGTTQWDPDVLTYLVLMLLKRRIRNR